METNAIAPRLARALLALVVAAALTAPTFVRAQDAPETAAPVASALQDTALIRSPNFKRAALEVFGANLAVWTFDRYIREGGTNPVFRIGFNSWQENLEAGWTWDDNSFSTNQFSHPYHGSLYYNAARSNGYSYWESIPFTFAGSFMWEYFGETHNASMNDWIATSVGGAALGEILHRLAGTIRDNTATGSSRSWREVGGLLVDPMGGVNRIIDGDWSRQYANPDDRFPRNYRSNLDIGLRTRGEEKLWEADTTDVYVRAEFEYGDPFNGDLGKPYDSFDFALQLNFGDKTKIGRLTSTGNLAGTFLKETDRTSHIVSAVHRFEYLNTNALEFGGQAVTAALQSRWAYDNGFEIRTDVEAGPMILGGASSDYASVSARSYDYGPGSTIVVKGELRRGAWTWVEAGFSHVWMHSISGNVADHHIMASYLRASLPVKYDLGLGLEFSVVNAERKYRDYEDVSQRNPQMKVYTMWGLN
jgi:hypothetical protein